MTEDTNDKILFRQTRFPAEQAPTLPPDLLWAVGQGDWITGGVGGGKSKVGEIIFADDQPYIPHEDPPGPGEQEIPTVPTPRINGVSSSNVYQTPEGVSKADVFISVDGMEGVEYEVVVSTS